MSTDYKTLYSSSKNENTLHRGSFNDFGDGTPARQTLAKQPEGHTYQVSIGPKGEIQYIYNEVGAVPVGSEQLLISYTVSPGTNAIIKSINVSGDNRGEFIIRINDNTIDKSRTWWTKFNTSFQLDGLNLLESHRVDVIVINRGEDMAPFNAKIGVDIYAI